MAIQARIQKSENSDEFSRQSNEISNKEFSEQLNNINTSKKELSTNTNKLTI